MYKKEALTALIAKIKENPDPEQAKNDLRLAKEACLSACAYMASKNKGSVLACFDGLDSEDVRGAKEERTTILRRLSYSLTAVNAMADFYATEKVFDGNPSSNAEVDGFCTEFAATLTKPRNRAE